MKEVLDLHPQVVDFAKKAIENCGYSLKMESIRGGTDGSRLSFMGLPCANLFTGMQGIHSKQEYVSIQDMEAAVKVLVELLGIWEREG
jgi:tripeptide aminopeptidase